MIRWLLVSGVCAALHVLSSPVGAQDAHGADKLVFIVRHAEKASATEPDPSLSDAGRARAEALAAVLRYADISDVIVTPRKRTTETAADVLRARQLVPTVVGFGANIAAHVREVAEAVRVSHGRAVLVVGHSNTVTAVITALGGPSLPELCDEQYAGLYILHLGGGMSTRMVRAEYGAADPPNAAACTSRTMR